MNILGLGKENITILTQDEIIKKGTERYKSAHQLMKKDAYERISMKENYERLKSEPLPYTLFRLNELLDYTLNLIGCEITEQDYNERLGVLPPVPFKYDIYSGYIVNECITGCIYEHLFKFNGKFYCVIMEAKGRALTNCIMN